VACRAAGVSGRIDGKGCALENRWVGRVEWCLMGGIFGVVGVPPGFDVDEAVELGGLSVVGDDSDKAPGGR